MVWKSLIYDKFAGDHGFCNELTKNMGLTEIEESDMNMIENEDVVQYFKTHFDQNYHMPNLNWTMYNFRMYSKVIDGVQHCYTIVRVNTNALYDTVKSGVVPVEFLNTTCRYNNRYIKSSQSNMPINRYLYKQYNEVEDIATSIIDEVMEGVQYKNTQCINDPEEVSVKLLDYQKCSIKWMLDKEKNHAKIRYNLNEEVDFGNVVYDMYQNQFFLTDKKRSVTFSGGGIIDEVGLGKTLQITTLSILNQSDNPAYIVDGCDRLRSRATLIVCPTQLCGQWKREITNKLVKKYNPVILPILTKKHFDSYTYQDILDADFVIISFTFFDNANFTDMWAPKLSTTKSYNKSNYFDNTRAGALFDELNEVLMNNIFSTLRSNKPMFHLIHWHRIVIDEFHEIHSNPKYSYIKNMIPFLKSTHRWMVSGTPFIDDSSLYNTIDYLTNYTNIDGDMILFDDSIKKYLCTDCFRRNTKDSVEEELTLPPIEEEVYWMKFTPTERMMYNAHIANPNNTKQDVYLRQLCCHPQLADETKGTLQNCKTLKDMENMMVSHYLEAKVKAENTVESLESRIETVEKRIKKIEDKKEKQKEKIKKKKEPFDNLDKFKVDMEGDDEDAMLAIILSSLEDENSDNEPDFLITLEDLKDTLKTLKERYTVAKKDLEGKTTTYDFYNNVINRIRKTAKQGGDIDAHTHVHNNELDNDTNVMNFLSKDDNEDEDEEEEVCGVCLDEIPENDIGVTKCGHIYCYECLQTVIAHNPYCPYCRKSLSKKDIYMLSYEKKKKEVDSLEDKQKNDLIEQVGTKLANLILFLKREDKHTIIFSQWDDLLRRVGKILTKSGIKNVFCRGNVYTRDKAIREFNEDGDIKVIMLSSESAASGTNLTKATQVILLDPVYGSYEYRRDTENQAIGRAHRLGQENILKVIRFVVKDTVEEEIYQQNIDEDKKHQDREKIKISEVLVK